MSTLSKWEEDVMRRCALLSTLSISNETVCSRHRRGVRLLKIHLKETGVNKKSTQENVDEFFSSLDEDHNENRILDEFLYFKLHKMRQQFIIILKKHLRSEGFNMSSL